WTVLGAAEAIRAMGPKYVVVKRGEYGSVLFGPDLTLFVPAVLLTHVVDPTGAGDTFAGGFMGHLSQGGGMSRENLAQALAGGTGLASFTGEAFSLHGTCNLSRESIEARRHQLLEMVRY